MTVLRGGVADQSLPAEAYAAALAGLPGMGPVRLAAFLEDRSPEAAWSDLLAARPPGRRLAAVLGRSTESQVRRWRQVASGTDVRTVWEQIISLGVGVALHGNPGYPVDTAGDPEPPTILFHRGSPEAVAGPRAAVVGTRRCSAQGRGVAFELGRDLASAGVAVVSGLASGIDAAAHRGALDAAAAAPIGVVATGPDVVYPREQRDLWRLVAEAGFLLGEAPPGAPPERWRFPARNRIIAGLADVVVVVESHARGGALHTVDEADRRGVDVMAVPGSVRSSASSGTNNLLAEGRAPVRDADDILVAVGLSARPGGARPEGRPEPAGGDREVLEAVGWQPATLDQLVLRTGKDVVTLVSALTRLVETGWVAERGAWYERVAG